MGGRDIATLLKAVKSQAGDGADQSRRNQEKLKRRRGKTT